MRAVDIILLGSLLIAPVISQGEAHCSSRDLSLLTIFRLSTVSRGLILLTSGGSCDTKRVWPPLPWWLAYQLIVIPRVLMRPCFAAVPLYLRHYRNAVGRTGLPVA